MDHQIYCLELSSNPIRFDPVSQLMSVFFDDSNKQVFAVRSNGATGIVVKSPKETNTISFCMEDKGLIRSIKFSPDNQILAVQRNELTVEFVNFTNGHPNLSEILLYKNKSSIIFGIVWLHSKEVALITKGGVEIYHINMEKRQMKLLKTASLSVNWFSWCPSANFALLSSANGTLLTPVILKSSTITKLPKLELDVDCAVLERDVTLAELNGVSSILILSKTPARLSEVNIYMLNGPGLAPRKQHVLRLGRSGNFAMNIVDNLIIVHHQVSATSMLFDLSLEEEIDQETGVKFHMPITSPKPLKPFFLKLPSLSLDGQSMKCELYSINWVIFQPDIIIDAKLGCLWQIKINLSSLCDLITNKVRLVETLLQRTGGKNVLLPVLRDLINVNYNNTLLPVIVNVFNKLNAVYKLSIDIDIQSQTGTPSSAKQVPKPIINPPRVLIDQHDLYTNVFNSIADCDHVDRILLVYLQSLAQHGISAQHDLSKMIVTELINRQKIDKLQQLINYSLIAESKPMACFLLSMSNMHPSVNQMSLDMLAKINANEILVEVLLEQGNVIDALRLKSTQAGNDHLAISARKYLEAAQKTNDRLVYHSVYAFFQQRNMLVTGSSEFPKSEKCGEYVQHYQKLFFNT